ncbi:hypothetical protein LOK49_LG03G00827 [Camellia lanceoleosa]|uniref:Uncharacterized protein n=1 Tax=Camellia lanceoleosa TaxID=1840588 RepID=A0ACC0IE82_9ERIC|nr:hypothetical protein LOK49_LG03G00827 [Camellia lanceoleosa]
MFEIVQQGNQWKERGAGTVKLLKHKGTGKVRLKTFMEMFQEVAESQQKKEENKDASAAAGLLEKLSVEDEKAAEDKASEEQTTPLGIKLHKEKHNSLKDELVNNSCGKTNRVHELILEANSDM